MSLVSWFPGIAGSLLSEISCFLMDDLRAWFIFFKSLAGKAEVFSLLSRKVGVCPWGQVLGSVCLSVPCEEEGCRRGPPQWVALPRWGLLYTWWWDLAEPSLQGCPANGEPWVPPAWGNCFEMGLIRQLCLISDICGRQGRATWFVQGIFRFISSDSLAMAQPCGFSFDLPQV